MQRVLVISNTKQPLMPCSSARARMLLKQGKAKVYRTYPFTIMLIEREDGVLQKQELKIDPGSKITGIGLVLDGKHGKKAVWVAHIKHRAANIVEALIARRTLRSSRRSRKTRYREPRFDNRTRVSGWLPPSLLSRVDNILNWFKRLLKYVPINKIAIETVRFDLQKLQNPEIEGVQYQQGTLFGYEVREYLLEKWQRKCAYCHAKNLAFEIDHIQPKSLGGSNRVTNLTLACHACNVKKGNLDIRKFLSHDQKRLTAILSYQNQSLKDAAAVNASRYAIGNRLKHFSNLAVISCSGGQTKFNRINQGYHKDHFIDAICLGESGQCVYIPALLKPLTIEACGRGSRQMCRVDRYGFPRTKAKSQKKIFAFKTGDIVNSKVISGKKIGNYFGRLAVRASGFFNIKTLGGMIQGISYKFCRLVHHADGYNYSFGGGVSSPS
jgi:5-methylcytosine-specific restriction endonuclease McrA